jgi:hypothetical protein
MTSSSALAKQVITESESSSPGDWAHALVAKISSMEASEQNSILLDICKSYCSQVNARQRKIKLTPDWDEEDIVIPADFENQHFLEDLIPTPKEVARREKRYLTYLSMWRDNLNQSFHHPELGMRFVKDMTAVQLREVSDYQKMKIAQSIYRNDIFDEFINSIPVELEDVVLSEISNDDGVRIAQSWETDQSLLVSIEV